MCVASTPLLGRVTEWLPKIDIEHEYECDHSTIGWDQTQPDPPSAALILAPMRFDGRVRVGSTEFTMTLNSRSLFSSGTS
jgi:hypothetical protein